MDNKKIYLDKIVQYMVDDTEIDYNNKSVNLLFLHPPMLLYFFPYPLPSPILEYCKDVYGLNDDETNYVLREYKNIIVDKINNSGSINESVDNKKKYLDKVVDFLVEDTKVDYEHRMIFFPFTYKRSLRQGSNNLTPFHRLLFETYVPIGGFMDYIDESFGITSEEGIVYVWETYKDVMRDIVFGKEDINESVDSKKIYLDKIVQYIIDDTIIDYDEGEVKYPYYSSILLINNGRLPFSVHSFRPFSIYCNDMYGLGIEEIQYVWKEYKNKLIGGEYINESMDRRDEYLNKIVDFLVDDTIIDYDKKMIRYPSPDPSVSFLLLTFHNRPSPFTFIPTLRPHTCSFSKFIKGNYGLTNDEIDYVWEEYKNIINEKIENVGSINESVDRKNDYLDKVVDFLMDDTEVGTGWFNPPYYIGNGRSSAGRTGFKSVYLHTFGLLDYTTYSGLDSQLIYFNSFCKNNYGLTEEETKIVWERYMKKLYESYNWGF